MTYTKLATKHAEIHHFADDTNLLYLSKSLKACVRYFLKIHYTFDLIT